MFRFAALSTAFARDGSMAVAPCLSPVSRRTRISFNTRRISAFFDRFSPLRLTLWRKRFLAEAIFGMGITSSYVSSFSPLKGRMILAEREAVIKQGSGLAACWTDVPVQDSDLCFSRKP